MEGDLRKQALASWQKLFCMPANLISDEARYDKLLRAADHMERFGLVQKAGALFASTAECIGGAEQKQNSPHGAGSL